MKEVKCKYVGPTVTPYLEMATINNPYILTLLQPLTSSFPLLLYFWSCHSSPSIYENKLQFTHDGGMSCTIGRPCVILYTQKIMPIKLLSVPSTPVISLEKVCLCIQFSFNHLIYQRFFRSGLSTFIVHVAQYNI